MGEFKKGRQEVEQELQDLQDGEVEASSEDASTETNDEDIEYMDADSIDSDETSS